MWKDWKIFQWFTKTTKEVTPSRKNNNIIKKIGLAFVGANSGRDNFRGPEGFDFEQIERAYLTDSNIRLATDKYVDFMFKAGWDIVGSNPATVEYVKQRLLIMSHATVIPTDQLLIDIAEELVKYHNVFIIKARAPDKYIYPPGIRAVPAWDNAKPIAGYFILPTNTILIDRDKNGSVRKYQQEIGTGEDPITIKPNDMIHLYIDKLPGRAFGYPFLWEVLDDVKLLRQIEELVDRMIYKNIFPTIVYQVGLPDAGLQSTDTEIEEVRELLGNLSLDGGLVLPERHNIKIIGAEGHALDVSGYLKYFEQRVFTGLGVSQTLMGRGDTSNRSTSDNMDAAFKDRIKAYQKIISTFINSFIINELLVEGGFDPILNKKDRVEFRFKEIDFDSKIKEENHAIQKFTQNAITHEELRMSLGLDPIAEEDRLYFNMISAALGAKAAQDGVDAANAAGDNKNQPANQHGKKSSPESFSLTKTEEFNKSLNLRWEMLRIDTIDAIKNHYSENSDNQFDTDKLKVATNLTITSMISVVKKHIKESFIEGVSDAQLQAESSLRLLINYEGNTELISAKTKAYLEKLILQDLIRQVNKALESESLTDKITGVVGAFSALKYRLKFISNTEVTNSYNLGFAKAARIMGYKEAYVAVIDQCDACQEYRQTTISLLTDNLPPFHPNCSCKLTLVGKE